MTTKENNKVPEETLRELYWKQGLSIRDIAKKLGVAKSTISAWLEKAKIPTRSVSEGRKQTFINNRPKVLSNSILDSLDAITKTIEDKIEPVTYNFKDREDISVPLPLKLLEHGNNEDITLTLAVSDLHLGHESHLPETYWSCIYNLGRVLKFLKNKYNILKFDIACNGDLVSGREVYKYQVFQNLIQRGHWQVSIVFFNILSAKNTCQCPLCIRF